MTSSVSAYTYILGVKSLRRYYFKNHYYFLTVVSYQRKPILIDNIDLFWESWRDIKLEAWVVLPDHFHVILNSKNKGISNIIHQFKRRYSWYYNRFIQKGRVWQNRYWDHIIRNQEDLNRHIDYIHYNPVKHKIIDDPFLYKHSSLIKYFENGFYPRDWGNDYDYDKDFDFGE
ncbi:MAG: transposase [Calditrichaeota bacterium]|nr:MAG: transposase [Calditrichota bacterium]